MGVGQALAALPPGAWMRGVAWAYPLVESLHIVALGTLFGAMAVVDLRLLGFSRALTDLGQILMAHQLIDQGGFTHVGAANEGKLRPFGRGAFFRTGTALDERRFERRNDALGRVRV